MRLLAAILTLCLFALLAGCNGQKAARSGGHIETASKSQFVSIADREALNMLWDAGNGVDSIHEIYADQTGDHALLVLNRAAGKTLWLDRPKGNAITEIKTEVEPQFVNFATQQAYGVHEAVGAAPQLATLPLSAEAAWKDLGPLGGPTASVLQFAGDPASGQVYALAQTSVVQDSLPQEGLAGGPASLSRESLQLFGSDGSSPPMMIAEFTRIGGELSPDNVKLVALTDGSACVSFPESGSLSFVKPDGQRVDFTFPSGHSTAISADRSQPAVWLYLRPRNANEGTGREDASCQLGRLIVVQSDGTQLASASAGSVPFSELSGDITSRRCLLSQSSLGVVEAALPGSADSKEPSAGPARLTWLLRNGGGAPLYLLAGGEQLWTALDSGIYGISADGLRKLAPSLSAAQSLPRAQALPLRTAVEALSWDWTATQISPLAGLNGKLTLFDSKDSSSDSAELDWSAKNKRAERLLVARMPKQADTQLRQADDAALTAKCSEMLTALGWPNAKLAEDGIARDDFGIQVGYLLEGDKPAGESGEFHLWITDIATLVTLDTPEPVK